jgi:TRAP-type mannitol/chloroaromatic compound transport system permease small subunit
MAKIRLLAHIVDTVNEWVGRITSLLILATVGVIIFEVVARRGFDAPTEWSFELSVFLFCGYILLGGGYTLLYGEHVNTDVIYRRFSLRTRAIVDLVTAVLFFLFCSVLLWEGGRLAWGATEMGRHSQTPWGPPLYPVLWVIPLGAGLLLVQGLAKFIRDLLTAVTGQKEEPHEH